MQIQTLNKVFQGNLLQRLKHDLSNHQLLFSFIKGQNNITFIKWDKIHKPIKILQYPNNIVIQVQNNQQRHSCYIFYNYYMLYEYIQMIIHNPDLALEKF